MEKLRTTLISIWENEIKEKFTAGKLVYERQLQADLYHLLKGNLGQQYEIWVEPVIYNEGSKLHKSKPDLVITKKEDIIAVIELKFMPWDFVEYQGDIYKLKSFREEARKGIAIWLGIEPLSANWTRQKNEGEFLYYNLNKNLLTSFIVFTRPESNAIVDFDIYKGTRNFILLYGYMEDGNNLVFDFEYNSG